MKEIIEKLLDQIGEKNPIHARRLATSIEELGEPYQAELEGFLARYAQYLLRHGRTLTEAVDSYVRFVNDMVRARVDFLSTGKYRNDSFREVNEQVYNNPEVMAYHMEGLLLSQFLWQHHYLMLQFFRDKMMPLAPKTRRYLEVGGGHGLHVDIFGKLAGPCCEIDVLDISSTSLEMCRQLIAVPVSRFLLQDIYHYRPEHPYDLISMGEVLEHVEDPVSLLMRLREMLSEHGRVFVTTPTNAPTVDHIFLFHDLPHIREIIAAADFSIESEVALASERTTDERIEKLKLTVLFGAILKKRSASGSAPKGRA